MEQSQTEPVQELGWEQSQTEPVQELGWEQSQTEPVQELNLQDATGLLHFLHVILVHRHLVWRPLPSSGTSRRAEWPGDSQTLDIKP